MSDVRTVADISPGDEFELSNSAPAVGNDISSCLEYAKADNANDLVGPNGPPSLSSSVSFSETAAAPNGGCKTKSVRNVA